MTTQEFFEQLDARIAKYDLLCHPFYKAWAAGELTREDLQEYARDYYHHVEAFPTIWMTYAFVWKKAKLRRAVLANMCDQKGGEDLFGEFLSALGLEHRYGAEKKPTVTSVCTPPPTFTTPKCGGGTCPNNSSGILRPPKRRWRLAKLLPRLSGMR